jgi:hypothetical protein
MFYSIIIAVIILIITILMYHLFFRFTLHILSKKNAEHILQRNADAFYETLTDMDLQMRGVSSIEEYRNNIANCCVEPTIRDRFQMRWIVMRACFTLCYTHPIRNEWFDSIKCALDIPWNIGIVDDTNRYEAGLSHTRGDIIFITRSTLYEPNIISTMIHEKIHTYQKTYPASIENYIRIFKFKPKITLRENVLRNGEYVRANPDTNQWIYTDDNNHLLKAVYLPNAETIRQVQYTPCNSQYCEHPYERMVYDILDVMKMQ